MPMEQSDIIKYRALYLQTARAYVNDMSRHVGILLTDVNNKDSLDIVHLAAHSLASQSVMMGYISLAALASLMERIIKAKQDEVRFLDMEVLKHIDTDLKRMNVSLSEIERTGAELDLSDELKALQALSRL